MLEKWRGLCEREEIKQHTELVFTTFRWFEIIAQNEKKTLSLNYQKGHPQIKNLPVWQIVFHLRI